MRRTGFAVCDFAEVVGLRQIDDLQRGAIHPEFFDLGDGGSDSFVPRHSAASVGVRRVIGPAGRGGFVVSMVAERQPSSPAV